MDLLYLAWGWFQRMVNEDLPDGSASFRDLGYL